MDVKCENCGTEYEFDDSKVTAAGITVKCTHCGNLFRVARAAEPELRTRETHDDLPSRPRHWMIRNRHGEIREFRDLSTLQQWIVEEKVAREDEISKTGESWKPLGSIVELSGFFRTVDEAAEPVAVQAISAEPLPEPPEPPPFGASDLMHSGRFRLEGPNNVVPVDPPLDDVPGDHEPTRPLLRSSLPPAPVRPPADTGPTPVVTRRHPPVQSVRSPVPSQRPEILPPVRHSGAYRFDAEAAPGYADPAETGRGFLMGVLATIAVAGAAYFVYDQFVRPGGDAVTERAEAGAASGELYLTLERAEAEYGKDTEAAFARADADYAEVLGLLGSPPSDRGLGVRAHLGRARVAMARAEYQKLEGGDPTVLLKAAEAGLAEARRLDEAEPEVALGYADFYRIQGSRKRANKFLAKVEAAGADTDEANLVRAAISVHNGDWAAAQSRLSKLPPAVLERPRARYLLAVALARSGRTEEAVFELSRLLARQTNHGPARRLLQQLGAAGAVPPSGAPSSAAPLTAAPVTAAPVTAAPVTAAPVTAAPVTAAPITAAPITAAPATAASRAPVKRKKDFDSLMSRARKAQENGRNTKARRLFLQALSAKPGNPEALGSLGWCDVDDGDYPRAISYFRQALQRHPGYADARYGLAVALERSKRIQEAVRIYDEYLRRHPRGQRAKMIKRKLTTLKGK